MEEAGERGKGGNSLSVLLRPSGLSLSVHFSFSWFCQKGQQTVAISFCWQQRVLRVSLGLLRRTEAFFEEGETTARL